MLPFQGCVGRNWQYFSWLGELGRKFAMARVEGVRGDLYDGGFERLRYERRSSSVPPTAVASTSMASTAFFLHLPSTACVSLLAHYCSITIGNYLFVSQSLSNRALRLSFLLWWKIHYLYRSLRPTELCVRLFFLRWEILYSYRSLRPTEFCVRLLFLTMINYQFVSKSPFDGALCSSFSFFVISVNAWWRRLGCSAVSLRQSSVFVVVSFIYYWLEDTIT